MEDLLVEGEVLSCLTWITTEKSHNFWSNYFIMLKFLQEFIVAVSIKYLWNRYLVKITGSGARAEQ